jgi:hypothetical protein
VISDLLGTSGRAIIKALIAGETNPERLLQHTTGLLKTPRERLLEGLRGIVTDHHRFMLRLHLRQIEALEAGIAQLERQITKLVRPVQSRVDLLTTIPGVSDTVAHVLVAEIGIDMARFPTPGHLVSWAGLCPRLDESAGKPRSTRVRHGAPWLKTTLVSAGWAAASSRGTYLRAQFQRLKARRGPKKAVVAVAASILTAAYFILRDGVPHRDLGPDFFDRRDRTNVVRRLRRRIEALGYRVDVHQVAQRPNPNPVPSQEWSLRETRCASRRGYRGPRWVLRVRRDGSCHQAGRRSELQERWRHFGTWNRRRVLLRRHRG